MKRSNNIKNTQLYTNPLHNTFIMVRICKFYPITLSILRDLNISIKKKHLLKLNYICPTFGGVLSKVFLVYRTSGTVKKTSRPEQINLRTDFFNCRSNLTGHFCKICSGIIDFLCPGRHLIHTVLHCN